MRVLPVNTDILLVELDTLAEVMALHRSLSDDPIAGVHEIVPAARTVMVRFHPTRISAGELTRRLLDRDVSAAQVAGDDLVEVPVRYTGPDLAEVAELTGLTVSDVIARHTGSTYTVAFTGFAPGFAYLAGGDPRLEVPRRRVPRTAIPSGAVGLAGLYSGVYPRSSPGGWQIIGTTELPMFDLASESPALLRPGMQVRFTCAGVVETDRVTTVPDRVTTVPDPVTTVPDRVTTVPARESRSPQRDATVDVTADGTVDVTADATPAVVVERPGLTTTLQDLGRPGHAALGVSRSGALDHRSLRAASRLVGNASGAACLETYGGLRLRAVGELVLAITGAEVTATIRPAPRPADSCPPAALSRPRSAPLLQPFLLDDGETLELGFPRRGSVAYVAVRGGFAVEPVLGSLSTDLLSGLGPLPLVAGDVLPIGESPFGAVDPSWLDRPGPGAGETELLPATGRTVTLDVVLGPHTPMFTGQALERLLDQEWEVTPESNRVGFRLHGEQPLPRLDHRQLESAGMASGALEVPSNGQPVLFMADHPLTGGYPVIASVASYHLDLAGQIPVGARLRFRAVTPAPQQEDRP